jgi:hypothetical protein
VKQIRKVLFIGVGVQTAGVRHSYLHFSESRWSHMPRSMRF